jgi:hypothetical protein
MEQQRNRYDILHPYATTTIRIHAQRLARDRVIPGMAREDYEQELAADLWRRLPAYRAELASLATYIDRVVRNRVSGFHVAAQAAARRHEREALVHPPADEWELERGMVVGGELMVPERLPEEVSLRHDLARFIAALPPALHRCCVIVTSESIGKALRGHGLHPSTYYENLRRLRHRAREAGLHEYLASAPRKIARGPGK